MLFRLGEEHEDAGAAVGHDGVLLFFRTARDGEAVAVFILGRFAVHQEHVVMRLVGGDIVESDVPGIERAIAQKRHLLPAGE